MDRQPFVNDLVHRCVNAFDTFLSKNLKNSNMYSRGQWHEGLKVVFDLALQLELHIALLDTELRFEWLRFGTPIDLARMTVHEEKTSCARNIIRAAIFPCLIERQMGQEGEKRCILRGIVIPQ